MALHTVCAWGCVGVWVQQQIRPLVWSLPGPSGWSDCVCMNHCVSTSGDKDSEQMTRSKGVSGSLMASSVCESIWVSLKYKSWGGGQLWDQGSPGWLCTCERHAGIERAKSEPKLKLVRCGRAPRMAPRAQPQQDKHQGKDGAAAQWDGWPSIKGHYKSWGDTKTWLTSHWQGLFSGLLMSSCLQCPGKSFDEKITTHSRERLNYGHLSTLVEYKTCPD